MKSVLLALSLGLASTGSFGSVKVDFSGACANGDFDASALDVEYFNLDLDLFGSGKKECVITTTIPGKRGFFVAASQFKAQGLAFDVDQIATMFVNHRFNGQSVPGARDIARFDEDLQVDQRAFAAGSCGKQAILRTKITVTTRDANVIFDQAQSSSAIYRFGYHRC